MQNAPKQRDMQVILQMYPAIVIFQTFVKLPPLRCTLAVGNAGEFYGFGVCNC
jgi:hypothetical protein